MAHPLAVLWPRLTPEVRAALATAHARYGYVSTGKAVAALRGLGGVAASVLDEMAAGTKVKKPLDVDRGQTALPDPLDTSPCVRATAGALLDTEGAVDDGRFLATLAEVSVGPTASQWRRDGFTGERVSRLVAARR